MNYCYHREVDKQSSIFPSLFHMGYNGYIFLFYITKREQSGNLWQNRQKQQDRQYSLRESKVTEADNEWINTCSADRGEISGI